MFARTACTESVLQQHRQLNDQLLRERVAPSIAEVRTDLEKLWCGHANTTCQSVIRCPCDDCKLCIHSDPASRGSALGSPPKNLAFSSRRRRDLQCTLDERSEFEYRAGEPSRCLLDFTQRHVGPDPCSGSRCADCGHICYKSHAHLRSPHPSVRSPQRRTA